MLYPYPIKVDRPSFFGPHYLLDIGISPNDKLSFPLTAVNNGAAVPQAFFFRNSQVLQLR